MHGQQISCFCHPPPIDLDQILRLKEKPSIVLVYRYSFINSLPCCDQYFRTLSNLHQHVTVVMRICASRECSMTRQDFRLHASLHQNLIEGMDQGVALLYTRPSVRSQEIHSVLSL
jgi:hypothetical protein